MNILAPFNMQPELLCKDEGRGSGLEDGRLGGREGGRESSFLGDEG